MSNHSVWKVMGGKFLPGSFGVCVNLECVFYAEGTFYYVQQFSLLNICVLHIRARPIALYLISCVSINSSTDHI